MERPGERQKGCRWGQREAYRWQSTTGEHTRGQRSGITCGLDGRDTIGDQVAGSLVELTEGILEDHAAGSLVDLMEETL